MASSSTSPPPAAETRNWLELPQDVTAMILHKLGAIEILESAQKVCMAWRQICKDPAMWRSIDMRNSGDLWDMPSDLHKMAIHAIDRSCGQLVNINIEYFGTDETLQYITQRTSQLRRLRLVSCYSITSDGLSEAAKGLPLLEELHMYFCPTSPSSKEAFETVGRSCPLLKSFAYNHERCNLIDCDDEALAIAGNMPELCHLQLFGNRMTNDGLLAILDGCPHLESLDLRRCFNVNLKGALTKRLRESIKVVRFPHDSTEDYEFNAQIHDDDSFGDDASGMSDIDTLYDYDDYLEFSGDSDMDRQFPGCSGFSDSEGYISTS